MSAAHPPGAFPFGIPKEILPQRPGLRRRGATVRGLWINKPERVAPMNNPATGTLLPPASLPHTPTSPLCRHKQRADRRADLKSLPCREEAPIGRIHPEHAHIVGVLIRRKKPPA